MPFKVLGSEVQGLEVLGSGFRGLEVLGSGVQGSAQPSAKKTADQIEIETLAMFKMR